MTRRLSIALGALLFVACSEPAPPLSRAELRASGGAFSVLPAAGQLPLCLLFETRGADARPLVSGEDAQSVPCAAGKPIGGKAFPPAQADPYRVIVVFSDRPLRADTVAREIGDRLRESADANVTAMDLRAPGQVTLQTLDVRLGGPGAPR